jgi:hypothetical protein
LESAIVQHIGHCIVSEANEIGILRPKHVLFLIIALAMQSQNICGGCGVEAAIELGRNYPNEKNLPVLSI